MSELPAVRSVHAESHSRLGSRVKFRMIIKHVSNLRTRKTPVDVERNSSDLDVTGKQSQQRLANNADLVQYPRSAVRNPSQKMPDAWNCSTRTALSLAVSIPGTARNKSMRVEHLTQ
ncbi:hypothetical protein [Aestuariivirga sp.]|uniref:hypothetical protein n=1 Tax=Aestuariivirga sp. TaxID=2650926 RepID=UPI003592F7B2